MSQNIIKKPILLKDLANELGYHESSIKRAAARRGFKPFYIGRTNNTPAALNYEDALAFKKIILDERQNKIIDVSKINPKISGVYFLEVPDYNNGLRVKIGWSGNVYERLSCYKTILPDLRIKAIWITTNRWCEQAAHKVAANIGTRINSELFIFEDINLALNELIDFFNIMGIATHIDKENYE